MGSSFLSEELAGAFEQEERVEIGLERTLPFSTPFSYVSQDGPRI